MGIGKKHKNLAWTFIIAFYFKFITYVETIYRYLNRIIKKTPKLKLHHISCNVETHTDIRK